MRLALAEFQRKVDADLEAIESGIYAYLRQVEWLFADTSVPAGEVKVRIALAYRQGLQEFQSMRINLLAKRRLTESISLN